MTVNNTVVGAYDYFPYGKLLRSNIVSTRQQRYLTTQHERDIETISENNAGTGLDNRGARFYDSDVARFLSLDPAAMEYPNLSDYSYVANNPIAYIDPDGKRWVKPTDKIERKQFNKSLRQLRRSSSIARRHIRTVSRSDHEVKVKMNEYHTRFTSNGGIDATNGKGAGGTLLWTGRAMDIMDVLLDGTTEVSAERSLLEEIVHASRTVEGKAKTSNTKAKLGEGWSVSEGSTDEEIETNNIVNKSLVEQGKENKQRTTYTFWITKTNSEGSLLDSDYLPIPVKTYK